VVEETVDVVVIGGGIVGCATALALAPERRVMVLEAEDRVAPHQSGHNSGVIHSGLYYHPDSLKARTCRAGREAMYRFCEEEGIPHRRSGKVVVATSAEELPALARLEARGRANGLALTRLEGGALREREPAVAGVAGLWVPETGVVDFGKVTLGIARRAERLGVQVRTGARVLGSRMDGGSRVIETASGAVRARVVVTCAGLQADRVARLFGDDPGVTIVPFRGEYYALRPERRDLVQSAIYPVPNPALPFLGAHFTRRIGGDVDAGPNAVLAWARHGYSRWNVSGRDLAETLTSGGFWRMAVAQWRAGFAELGRSYSKRLFVRALRRLVPQVDAADLVPAGSGVRAQAVNASGQLVDDFHIVEGKRTVHVLNAPSPAATASLAIGMEIATRVTRQLSP
jgi:(S)-2-hydroxyglutarate dehydrogenase